MAAKRVGVESRLGNRSNYKEPEKVADTVKLALAAPTARRRCMVVPNPPEGEFTIRKAIEEMVQLDAGHSYCCDRAMNRGGSMSITVLSARVCA
jgi:hypothetical protein